MFVSAEADGFCNCEDGERRRLEEEDEEIILLLFTELLLLCFSCLSLSCEVVAVE